jgi:hypothetical protein
MKRENKYSMGFANKIKNQNMFDFYSIIMHVKRKYYEINKKNKRENLLFLYAICNLIYRTTQ